MKKLTLTVAVFSALGTFAYAGPESLPSGKEMKEVAPAPEPTCFDWGGFYVGAFGGYKRSNVDLDLRLSGGWDSGPISRDETEAAGSGDLDNDGAELGGLIGYNFQWHCLVLGLEADGGYLWARDSDDSGILPSTQFSPHHVRSSFQTHYLATVAPRIGYAFGRLLPYVTGGLAVGDLEFEQSINFPGSGPTAQEGGSRSDTNAGWMVGGGLQYALTAHWSVRGQYQYIDLGSISFHSDFPNTGQPPAPADSHAELTEHNASFGIIYKF